MPADTTADITLLLSQWSGGDRSALDRLIPLMRPQLVRLAQSYLERERVGHTLQATALVNEVYLKLVDQQSVSWKDRAHFVAIAATIMRRLLVDYARRRNAEKRGGANIAVTLDEARGIPAEESLDLVALDEALGRLHRADATKSRIIELRFFGGLSVEETAAVVGLSRATVNRHWKMARAWLYHELSTDEEL